MARRLLRMGTRLAMSLRGLALVAIAGGCVRPASVGQPAASPPLVRPDRADPRASEMLERPPDEPARASSSIAAASLEGARWIEGRVVLPPGTPSDERLEVVATGRKLDGVGHHRALVGEHGRFRVAFHPRSRRAQVELRGRYVVPMTSERFDLDDPRIELVLEPELGGRIVGVCSPPNRPAAHADGIPRGRASWSAHGGYVAPRVDGALDASGRFELDGVRAGVPGTFDLVTHDRVPIRRTLSVAAGETRELRLSPRAGVALVGVVLDDAGAALGCAKIWLHTANASGAFCNVRSAPDGTFAAAGLEPGSVEIEAECGCHVPSRSTVVIATEGERREGVVVRMGRGLSIAGLATWTDGAPASGVQVSAERTTPRLDPGAFEPILPRAHAATTDAGGAFEIRGLVEGSYRLSTSTSVEPGLVRAGARDVFLSLARAGAGR